jgi:hypothetical protein
MNRTRAARDRGEQVVNVRTSSKFLAGSLALALVGCVPPEKLAASAQHYTVPPGYDADVSLHPYTSGVGVCPEGAQASTGCFRPGRLMMPSHYELPPFNR